MNGIRKVTAAVLDRTAQLLQRSNSWTKQTLRETRKGRTCYCLVGALEQACSEIEMGYLARYAALSKLRSVIEGRRIGSRASVVPLSVIGFNDDRQTRHSDVVKVLKEARSKLK